MGFLRPNYPFLEQIWSQNHPQNFRSLLIVQPRNIYFKFLNFKFRIRLIRLGIKKPEGIQNNQTTPSSGADNPSLVRLQYSEAFSNLAQSSVVRA